MFDNICGRQKEIKKLKRIFRSKSAEFITVYGRRRVGKTYLIKQFFNEKDCYFFSVTGLQKGDLSDQIKNFTQAMSDTFYAGADLVQKTDWLDTFKQLHDAIKQQTQDKKTVIFLDELPWLATTKSKLIQVIDYYWNEYWSHNPNICLIVCGSASSWIIENILEDTGGLHNRPANKIVLQPFSLLETKKYLRSLGHKLNHQQIVERYMVFGGIPFYLKLLNPKLSLADNINELCFYHTGELFNEFHKLYHSLFKNSEAHIELIELIATKKRGLTRTEIERKAKLSQKGGTLSTRLNELEISGFIQSFKPQEQKRKGTHYKLIDEYSLFYLKWIAPMWGSLTSKDTEYGFWQDCQQTPSYQNWCGAAFEAICYKHIAAVRKGLNITNYTNSGSWQYTPPSSSQINGAQIDLVFNRRDDMTTLCEIKYSQKPYAINKEYAQKLLNKLDVYQRVTKTTKQLVMTMICSSGLKKTMYSEELIADCISADDLFT